MVGSLPLVSTRHAIASDFMHKAAERALVLSKETGRPGVRASLQIFDRYEPDGRG